jgi:hypothetical protein
MNQRGEPCGSRAITKDGKCAAHSGIVDMRAIGMAGGRASVRSRLGLDPELADGRLRKKAKAALEALLDSEDEGRRLSAARALYSYAPAKPVDDERIAELLDNATETGRIVEDAALREAVERAAEKLAAVNRAEGDRFHWDRLAKAEQLELDRLLAKGRNGR